MQVNGQSLLRVTHEFAVDTFVKAGGNVNMVIIPGEETRAKVCMLNCNKQFIYKTL